CGALTFGPEGILFVGDPQGAAIFAIGTSDTTENTTKDALKLAALDEKIASRLGVESNRLQINDMAVNPISTNVYVSVTRGKGTDAAPVMMRVTRKGDVEEFSLKDVPFAKTALPNATTGRWQEAITCMGYLKGKLYVAGLSNEEFASKLR